MIPFSFVFAIIIIIIFSLWLLIFFFFSSYFIQYSNSITSSLSLNYWYFLSLFFFKKIKNVIFYLNSNKRKLCSSNCTHFFNICTFSNLSYSLYLFISINILPWYHSSSFLLSFFILFFFYYHSLSINLSFTLLLFT